MLLCDHVVQLHGVSGFIRTKKVGARVESNVPKAVDFSGMARSYSNNERKTPTPIATTKLNVLHKRDPRLDLLLQVHLRNISMISVGLLQLLVSRILMSPIHF